MNRICAGYFLAFFTCIHLHLCAADIPIQYLIPAELSSQRILRTPSCRQYATADGSMADNWAAIDNKLLFYSHNSPYYELTNVYPAAISVGGKIWQSSEHFYQAMKFTDAALQEEIRQSKTSRQALAIADKYRNHVRADWRQIHMSIMALGVYTKFAQYEQLSKLLLGTGNKVLIQDSGHKDILFGAGARYTGRNYLGRILMLVRVMLGGAAGA